MSKAGLWATLLCSQVAYAQATPQPPAPPTGPGVRTAPPATQPVRQGATAPELRRTTEAFLGTWVLDANVTMPGQSAKPTKLTLNCDATALGKAAICEMIGPMPDGQTFEAGFLIGYDTYSKRVHFMAITSNEEVHDHLCSWRGDTLECDPLKAGMSGREIREELRFTFSDRNKSNFRSQIVHPDGSRMIFEGTATRVSRW